MTETILPPPSGPRSINARRPRPHEALQSDLDVAGIPSRVIMWIPIAAALLLGGAVLAWLLSRADLSTPILALRSASLGNETAPTPHSSNGNAEGSISPVFSPEVQRWEVEILRWAAAFNLNPNLIATVMQIESCGHPSVRSSAGAVGLFQVMPYHFSPGEDPQDPETNAARGLAYLARGMTLGAGRTELALAGYNGGHGVIGRHASQWSAETQRFVAWGSGILADVSAGITHSPTLQAWLQAGGASLCRRASAVQLPQSISSAP